MVIKIRAVRYTLALCLLLFFCFKSQAQNNAEKLRALRDSSLGIVISEQKFDSLVNSLLIQFRSDTSAKKIEDYLLLIRVGNTIEFDHLYLTDSLKGYDELLNLYLFKYMNKIEKLTHATISIGYSLYSKEYNLQIGGMKTKDNFFKIVH